MNITDTPWGQADVVEKMADGIYHVDTSSHGGIMLDAAHVARIPKAIGAGCSRSRAAWEEDCDWAVPFLLFYDEIADYEGTAADLTERVKATARQTLERWHPNWLNVIDHMPGTRAAKEA